MYQRVSNMMIQGMVLSDSQNNLRRLLTLQHQIATEQKYSKPSDNPIDVTRSMTLGTEITENVQYQRNMDDAVTWLKNTDTALNQIGDVFQRIRELAIYAGDGGLESTDLEAIAQELAELREEMRNCANYSVAGNFLLSGTATDQTPFVVDANGKVIYQGNRNDVSFEVERQVLGKVSFNGREIFPEDDTTYVLESIEVPIDFSWKGRSEIIQFQVGDRTVKARVGENWSDDDKDNLYSEVTDLNGFRDEGELEGLTLDQIAAQINGSLEMGDVSGLISVEVIKDEAKGTQRLQIVSHTGEPVRVTSWQETDFAPQPQVMFGNEVGLTGAWTAGSAGTLQIELADGTIGSVDIAAGDDLAAVQDKINQLVPGIRAEIKDDPAGTRQTLLLYAKERGIQAEDGSWADAPFTLQATGSGLELFGTYDYANPLGTGGYPVSTDTRYSGVLTDVPGVKGAAVPAAWTAAAGDSLTVSWSDGKAETLTLAGGESLSDVAQALIGLYDPTADPTDANHSLWAEVRTDAAGQQTLYVYGSGTKASFNVTSTGTALPTALASGSSGAVFRVPDQDQSHSDLTALLQIETSLKSKEIAVGATAAAIPAGESLHWKLESGTNEAELIIPGGATGKALTLEELRDQINGVAGTWLEAVVQTDPAESTGTDILDRGGTNSETATQKLILRTKDGAPLAVFDGASAGTNNFAEQLGVSTGLSGSTGAIVLPSDGAGALEEGMPVHMQVTVGDDVYDVRVCRSLITNTAGDGLRAAQAIAKQVNEAYDPTGKTTLLKVDDQSANGRFVLYATTGEPLTITDSAYGDPAFKDFTGGVAIQMGVAAGITGDSVPDTLTPGSGTIRIQSNGRSLDVAVEAGDTLEDVSRKIKQLGVDWLDVSFYDPDPSNTGQNVRLALAARDGSPLTVYTATGATDLANAFGLSTDLRSSADVSGWAAAPGDALTLTVNGRQQTIDLDGLTDLKGLADRINARYQGQDVRAEVITVATGDQRLVLSSPQGYGITVDGAPAALNLPAGSSPSRGGDAGGTRNQQVVTKTSGNIQKQDFFGVVDDLIAAVRSGDTEGISEVLLGKVDDFGDNLLRYRTQEGALVKRYDNSTLRLKENNLNLTELQSKISDVDLAEATTQYQMAQAVYQASLAVIARIIQPTLVDFLS